VLDDKSQCCVYSMSLRFKRFHARPTALFIDMEGCLLDHGCQVTVNAVQAAFAESGVEISDVEAASKNDLETAKLVGTDLTCKKTQLRHVLMTVAASKWEAAKGAAPTEWDLEALFKAMERLIQDGLSTAKPVPGAVEALAYAKETKGMKVACTSNFAGDVKDAWERVGNHHNIVLDANMSCADVPNPGIEGTFTCVLPNPWRCMSLAAKLNIFPLSTIVRVSTTPYGIEEGLNAGMWTVACADTGLVQPFIHPNETEAMRKNRIAESFHALGCHYVIDGIWDLNSAVDDICLRMSRGETP
jgi:phosphonoacetaldehyde hydrolase